MNTKESVQKNLDSKNINGTWREVKNGKQFETYSLGKRSTLTLYNTGTLLIQDNELKTAYYSKTFIAPERNQLGSQESSHGLNLQELDQIQSTLSEDQLAVLNLCIEGRNVFFSGKAGSGKSYLLEYIVNKLRVLGKMVSVTASTGIAAIQIRGTTLHSFAGIGKGDAPFEVLLGKAKKREKWWKRTQVLVVDEISMISGELFDSLDKIAQNIRGNTKPFGGIQIIASGDFLQLAPVAGTFAFESESWATCFDVSIELTSNFRQKDALYLSILEFIRYGTNPIPEEELNALLHCVDRELTGQTPLKIFATNKLVDQVNTAQLESIESSPINYKSYDIIKGNVTPQTSENMLNQLSTLVVPQSLDLKVGCEVMLLRNKPPILVNGSRGIVVDFVENTEMEKYEDWNKINEGVKLPIVQFHSGPRIKVHPEIFTIDEYGSDQKVQASRTQIPLKLSWALTVHKCQGMTLDEAEIDFASTFTEGQIYVAISRVRSLDGLVIKNFDIDKIRANPKAIEFHRTLRQFSTN